MEDCDDTDVPVHEPLGWIQRAITAWDVGYWLDEQPNKIIFHEMKIMAGKFARKLVSV